MEDRGLELIEPRSSVSPLRSSFFVSLIVWAVWTAMFGAAIGYVAHFGRDVPYWDDWVLVPYITGNQPVTLEWLWHSHNGHRIFLPKLVLIGLLKLSGLTFRVGMFADVLMLGAASAALILAARRVRQGRVSLTDAFFPLLLLHWRHDENLLWTWQVTQVLPIALICLLLGIAARHGTRLPARLAIATAIGVLMLPLCGAPGVVYALPLSVWMLLAAGSLWRERRIASIAVGSIAALTLVLCGLYFHAYHGTEDPIPLDRPMVAIKTAIQSLGGAIGLGALPLWRSIETFTVLSLGAAVAALLWRAWRDDAQRRGLALLLFMAGGLGLALSIGLGRPGRPLIPRYLLCVAPAFCIAYFAAFLVDRQRVTRVAQWALLIVMVIAAPACFRAGYYYGRDYRVRMRAVEADIAAGLSPGQLVARNITSLWPTMWLLPDGGIARDWGGISEPKSTFPCGILVSMHQPIADRMRMLQRAGAPAFRKLNINDAPMRAVKLSSLPFTAERANGTDNRSAWVLTFKYPLDVCGFRVPRPTIGRADFDPALPPDVQVFWRFAGQREFIIPQRYMCRWDANQPYETIWIFGRIDRIAVLVGDEAVQQRLAPDQISLDVFLPAISQDEPPTAKR